MVCKFCATRICFTVILNTLFAVSCGMNSRGYCNMANNSNYSVILSESTLAMVNTYRNALSLKSAKPGAILERLLSNERINLEETSDEDFIQLLLWTKIPMIFVESEVSGDGTDWNQMELRILGDLSIAMKVLIYDNGIWSTRDTHFRQHIRPINGFLLFMPGPLLDGAACDLQEIIENNAISQSKYNRLIGRRLIPLLFYINESAAKENKRAFVTIPGVGAGQFAGRFRGTIGEHLNSALQTILTEHAPKLSNIACIYYDPFEECANQERDFGNVKFRVRPAYQNVGKSLLCDPTEYQEQQDDFGDCQLFKVVAWDHVSFPGNDFFGNSRFTDDGVSAAATNSMQIITGVEGKYQSGNYQPPTGKRNWLQVVCEKQTKLKANQHNIHVFKDNLGLAQII